MKGGGHAPPEKFFLNGAIWSIFCCNFIKTIFVKKFIFYIKFIDIVLLRTIFWGIEAYTVVVVCPNVKGEWVDSNFQIIDVLVRPRAAGVDGTLIFVHIGNFATLVQPWPHVGSFTCRIFNSLHTHKGPVLLCAPPRHRAM